MNDDKSTQTAVRLSPEVKARMMRISAELTRRSAGSATGHGLPTVARLCVERGLPILESELELTTKVRKK